MNLDQIPGARWLRCDLHVHTPFDREKKFGEDVRAAIEAFRKADTTRLSEIAERFVDACTNSADGNGINVVALTDHNSIEGYKRLSPFFSSISQRLSEEGKSSPEILPGVEFSVGGERPIHFLVIFSKTTNPGDIEGCIRHVFGARDPFDPSSGTPRASGQSVDDFLKKLYAYCHPSGGDRHLSFIVLPAHADGSRGLAKSTGAHLSHSVAAGIWDEMKGHLRQWVITRREWHGFQTNKSFQELPEEFKNLLCRWLVTRRGIDWEQLSSVEKDRIRQERHWPLIETSDPHNYEEIGTRFTWIKMEVPDVEGIRLALLDPQSRLRRMVDGPPGADYPIIRRLEIQRTDFFEDFDISLNPCLNTFIGGRGSGKSTAIECLRFVLDRAQERDFDEDEEEIRKMVEDFLREKPSRDYGETKGMLLPDYNITADVTVAGRLYRIVRNSEDKYVVPDPEKADSTPQPLDIRTLVAPRILSQRQIARIARDPAAQRRELDALRPREETQAFEEKQKEILGEIERLQITRRKLRDQRAKLPAAITELQKIKDQIDFLEQGGNREILEEYRAYQNEQLWLEDTLDALMEIISAINDQKNFLRDLKEKIGEPPEGPSKLWIEAVADKVKGALDGALADLDKQSTQIKSLQENILKEQTDKWKPGFDKTVGAYKELEKEMKTKGIQFDQHEKLLQQRAFLEKEIKRLQGIEDELKETESQLKNQRERLVLLYEDRMKKRRALAETLERDDADVRLEIVPFGDRDHLASQREAWFAGAGLQVRDWEVLIEFVYSQGNGITDRLAELVHALRKDIETTEKEGKTISSETSEVAKLLGNRLAGNLTRNFYNALIRSDRIYLDKMEQFLPEDRVEARVRGSDGIFKPITQGSIGQRSTAILSLLLSAGDQPLIIDQPEDDLDNQYIYEVVVDLLRKRKFSRQIIIATHNANIPVNGDAELIVALDVENRLGRLLVHGSIDRDDIKDQVSRIMEGSAEAFRLRKERYGY